MVQFEEWDKGVFASEIVKNNIYPQDLSNSDDENNIPVPPPAPLAEGTYHGSKKAATEMYHRIQQR
jgi:hypothetical protein